MMGTPADSGEDPFAQADAASPPAIDVTSRILAKHAAMKALRGGTSRLEQLRATPPSLPAVRTEVVIALIIANGWVAPERIDALREFFRVKGATQALARDGRIARLLVDRGLLEEPGAGELERTLPDVGIFPRYRINRLLGQGVVGRTYLAVDLGTGQDVALKIFRQRDEASRQRFLQDHALLEGIRSRRLAQALASGSAGAVCFAASAYTAGERLSELMSQRRIASEVQAVRLALLITEGLAYVQVTTGLCHLALRPENILVDQAGPRLSAVLTDFGVASQVPLEAETYPHWRAPECLAGAQGDMRSDIFTVGALLYNLLGGIGSLERRAVPSAAGTAPAIDLTPFHPTTRDIIYTCASDRPEDRFRDYRTLIAALTTLARALGHIEQDEVPTSTEAAVRSRSQAHRRSGPSATSPTTRSPTGPDPDDWIG